jgi:hypothetical protein
MHISIAEENTNALTLIHLVSEQPMPNLLAIIAVRPERVIQIASQDLRFVAVGDHLIQAADALGIDAEFRSMVIPSSHPSPEDVRYLIKQMVSVFPNAVVNITAGTKLMSLGAFQGASEFRIPILYCDSVRREFVRVDASHSSLVSAPFDAVARSLNLKAVMAAHGKAPGDWKFDTASPAQINFGRIAWELRAPVSPAFDRGSYGEPLRAFFRSDKGRIPGKPATLQALASANILDALPSVPSDEVLAFLDAAAEAGFLERRKVGFRLARGVSVSSKLRSHVERVANLLDGSWLELSVLHFAAQSGRHQDLHWSVEPSAAGAKAAEYGETDVVAIDSDRSTLEIISCKTGLSQPLEHLEGLRTRANNLGGSHAIATLAVLRHQDEAKLRQWGRLLRVNVLIGDEIPRYFTAP